MTAATGRAARTRGHSAERRVAAHLRDHGFPDAATSRSALGHDGTRQPGDIVGVPGLCISVKDVAGSAFPTWLRQARAEAEPAGLIPVVVRRTRGNPDVGEWIAVADWAGLGYVVVPAITPRPKWEALVVNAEERGWEDVVVGSDGWAAMRFATLVARAKGMAP